MLTEEWRPVVGFEGVYEVSDQGRVKRVGRGRGARLKVLSPGDSMGYPSYGLWKGGKVRSAKAHILVAAAFSDSVRGDGPCINHIDGNKANNAPANLERCSYSHNNTHAIYTGLVKRLRPVVRSDGAEFVSVTQAARSVKADPSHIVAACAGRTPTCRGFKWTYKEA